MAWDICAGVAVLDGDGVVEVTPVIDGLGVVRLAAATRMGAGDCGVCALAAATA